MDEIFTLKTNNLKIGFASHGTRDFVLLLFVLSSLDNTGQDRLVY